MRLAIIADWLSVFGGAEHTIAEFHDIWPQAPIFTTVVNRKRIGPLAQADIRTTPLQRWYRVLRRHQLLLPWMPRAIESIDLRGFDVILSSSHAVSKGVVPDSGALHVCYCHTPMRYAWEMEDEYLSDFRVPSFLRSIAKKQLARLRRWDLTTAKRVDIFIANSAETKQRISRIYNRDSIVIPPPVDERFFQVPLLPIAKRSSYLAIGRLVPYKRFDLLVSFANATGIELVIAGKGSEEARLRRMAKPNVRFLGFVKDGDLPGLYASAKSLLFPQYEDAGIVPLEAQACGTPIIAFGKGGAIDTVADGVTGVLFPQQTIESLQAAIDRASHIQFDPSAIREHARMFSAEGFRRRIKSIVEDTPRSH